MQAKRQKHEKNMSVFISRVETNGSVWIKVMMEFNLSSIQKTHIWVIEATPIFCALSQNSFAQGSFNFHVYSKTSRTIRQLLSAKNERTP